MTIQDRLQELIDNVVSMLWFTAELVVFVFCLVGLVIVGAGLVGFIKGVL